MTGPGETLVAAEEIAVILGGRTVLQDVSLSVHEGEIVTLIGPNGAGKSTLVRVILGLLKPAAGKLRRRSSMRIGYMPQRLSVDEVLPLTVRRFLQLAGPTDAGHLRRVLGEVGVEHLLERPIQGISGGEMQRAVLARALLRDPDLLVLDEPVQGVDVTGQVELYDLIAGLRRRRGCGVLMVSHDLHLVMAATDNVVCLNGHVCCMGHPESVSRHPAYLELFGSRATPGLAVYTHHHDHVHDMAGTVDGETDAAGGSSHG